MAQRAQRRCDRQYENLKQFTVARAASYGVDADELLEGLVFSKLQLTGKRTFSSATRKGLQTPAGQMRELDILTVDGAIALMGLFLRSRGQCLVPGEIASFREWDALPPWWFYRVGAWAVLREAHICREHWPADKRANPMIGFATASSSAIQPLLHSSQNAWTVAERKGCRNA